MMNIMNSNDQRSSTVNDDEQRCRAMKLLGSVRKEGVPECHGQLENINTSIINISNNNTSIKSNIIENTSIININTSVGTDTRSFQALKH